jgi:transcriptional regulator with XRE-family HTH domain
MHTWGVTIPYADVLARNVRAERARLGLEQELLAVRMRALGFTVWVRQTVARVEAGKRRLTAEELFGLALALETRLSNLLEPARPDDAISLPSGAVLPVLAVHEVIHGGSRYVVHWDGDNPRLLDYDPPRDRPFENWLPPPKIRRDSPQHGDSIRRIERKNPPRRPGPYAAEDLRPRVEPQPDESGDDE